MASYPKSGVGGWLLLFCALLLIWQPISLALAASAGLDSLEVRGTPAVLLLLIRITVAALGIAAGLAILRGRPGAVWLAKASLVVAAAADVLVYATGYFPSNLPPGDAPLAVAASLTYYGAWMVYLLRSKRVRALE
jgi:hypothetical protein